jgi:hypothetical protein
MRREVPPYVIALVGALAAALIAGAWFFSGGSGQMSPAERDLAEKQTEIQTERFDQNLGGGSEAVSEEEARSRSNR